MLARLRALVALVVGLFRRNACPPLRLTVTNAARAILAHWLAYKAWKGKLGKLRARVEIFEALKLDEIQAHRDPRGLLIGMHLPAPPPALPALLGAPEQLAAITVERDRLMRSAEEQWLAGTMDVELSQAAARLAFAELQKHPIAPNLGPAMVKFLEQLKRCCG
jgi:hypothetical protein